LHSLASAETCDGQWFATQIAAHRKSEIAKWEGR
jgi:hypothetical protein